MTNTVSLIEKLEIHRRAGNKQIDIIHNAVLDACIETARQHEAQQPAEDMVERVAEAIEPILLESAKTWKLNTDDIAKAAISAYELRGVGLTDAKRQEEGETPAKEQRVEVPITTPDTLIQEPPDICPDCGDELGHGVTYHACGIKEEHQQREITEQDIKLLKEGMTFAIYERIKMKRPYLPPGNGEAMAYANAALDIVKPYLKREAVDLNKISSVIAALYTNWETFTSQRPTPRETAKAVLDALGISYDIEDGKSNG